MLTSYIYLVYHKSLKHYADNLSCAVIGKAVGLCVKTVRGHLHTLASEGLIHLANCGDNFSCTLCPIRNKLRTPSNAEVFPEYEGGQSA